MRFSIVAIATLVLSGVVGPQSTPPVASPNEPGVDNEYVRVFYYPVWSNGVPLTHKFDALCISEFDAPPADKSDKKASAQFLPYVRVDYFPREPFKPVPVEGVPLKTIWIEIKSQPPQSPFVRDAVTLDPDHNLVLFENDHVRVVRVHFGLGEKGPIVDKRPRVIILLNDMHADVARREGDTPSPRDGKAGVIQWSLGGSQATMNRNETKLDNIVVEIKGK